jgi:hypothetical protein
MLNSLTPTLSLRERGFLEVPLCQWPPDGLRGPWYQWNKLAKICVLKGRPTLGRH